jgi:hypothetical protein
MKRLSHRVKKLLNSVLFGIPNSGSFRNIAISYIIRIILPRAYEDACSGEN